MKRVPETLVTIVVMVMNLTASAIAATGYPIAGLHPDSRPQGAPRLTQVTRNSQWYRQALHGITPPYPASLKFLEDQGNWFTPFNHPGMAGPYDIRSWHQR